ncbi:MAG: hypothetical protein IPP52_03990 [Ignavibacteria bacterium]|nr:hypothetical protein [Ignavibacteria bacterium]
MPHTLPSCDTFHLNLGAFIQGRYIETKDLMIGDTIEVELRNNFSPYSLVESATGYLNDSGKCILDFHYAVNGVNYFIVFKHRNSIETWSITPGQSFSGDVLNFDFLSSANVYGGNVGLIDSVPLWYGILSGDVNQDGIIDGNDLSLIDNDASNFVTGYVVTDLNGDLFVDAADLSIVDNNPINAIVVVRP